MKLTALVVVLLIFCISVDAKRRLKNPLIKQKIKQCVDECGSCAGKKACLGACAGQCQNRGKILLS